jgi:hypothetical protein
VLPAVGGALVISSGDKINLGQHENFCTVRPIYLFLFSFLFYLRKKVLSPPYTCVMLPAPFTQNIAVTIANAQMLSELVKVIIF